MAQEETCILMEFECWNNSPLSIAKYCGGININSTRYVITNDPYDLIRADFEEDYKRLGRDRFMQVIKDNYHTPPKKLLKILKTITE